MAWRVGLASTDGATPAESSSKRLIDSTEPGRAEPSAAVKSSNAKSSTVASYGCCDKGSEVGNGLYDWDCDSCRKYIHFECQPKKSNPDRGRKICQSCHNAIVSAPAGKRHRRNSANDEGESTAQQIEVPLSRRKPTRTAAIATNALMDGSMRKCN